jgi:hypothetical protein
MQDVKAQHQNQSDATPPTSKILPLHLEQCRWSALHAHPIPPYAPRQRSYQRASIAAPPPRTVIRLTLRLHEATACAHTKGRTRVLHVPGRFISPAAEWRWAAPPVSR